MTREWLLTDNIMPAETVVEMMRDNCSELRELAMIDMLASMGMRFGEKVLLNCEDYREKGREFAILR